MNIRLRISIDIGRAAHWQLRAGLSWFDPGLSWLVVKRDATFLDLMQSPAHSFKKISLSGRIFELFSG